MLVAEPMRIPSRVYPALPHPKTAEPLPRQAEMVLSAIEAGQHGRRERRVAARARYRVTATIRLFSDGPDAAPWVIYTRDVNARGLGFITPHRLPLGYGGLVDILLPDGRQKSMACTLLRCRETAPGWFDGSLSFNRQQTDFAL